MSSEPEPAGPIGALFYDHLIKLHHGSRSVLVSSGKVKAEQVSVPVPPDAVGQSRSLLSRVNRAECLAG